MRAFLLLTASLVTATAFAQDDAADSNAAPAADAGAPAGGSAAGQASDANGTAAGNAVKTLSGMSVLGNEEAPKSLVIVPWKSSRLGDGLGIGNALDESPRAVDREVFMRELHFYELRSGGIE